MSKKLSNGHFMSVIQKKTKQARGCKQKLFYVCTYVYTLKILKRSMKKPKICLKNN